MCFFLFLCVFCCCVLTLAALCVFLGCFSVLCAVVASACGLLLNFHILCEMNVNNTLQQLKYYINR
jgi:hypothetical protein